MKIKFFYRLMIFFGRLRYCCAAVEGWAFEHWNTLVWNYWEAHPAENAALIKALEEEFLGKAVSVPDVSSEAD